MILQLPDSNTGPMNHKASMQSTEPDGKHLNVILKLSQAPEFAVKKRLSSKLINVSSLEFNPKS